MGKFENALDNGLEIRDSRFEIRDSRFEVRDSRCRSVAGDHCHVGSRKFIISMAIFNSYVSLPEGIIFLGVVIYGTFKKN